MREPDGPRPGRGTREPEEGSIMRKRNSCEQRSVVALAVALALSTAAIAEGRGRGGLVGPPGGPGVPGGPDGPSGGVIERLLFPCRAACLDAGRACMESGDVTAVTCAEGACGAEIATARSACLTDPGTADCRTARGTLRECVQPCVSARREAAEVCRTTVDDCLDACGADTAE